MAMRKDNTSLDVTGAGSYKRPVGWLSRLGMQLISYFAEDGGGFAAGRPQPCNEPIGPVKCCHLACPNTECPYEGSKANFTCPEGYTKTAWMCCEGSTQIGCGECSAGNNCFSGPWYCSIWFEAGTC